MDPGAAELHPWPHQWLCKEGMEYTREWGWSAPGNGDGVHQGMEMWTTVSCPGQVRRHQCCCCACSGGTAGTGTGVGSAGQPHPIPAQAQGQLSLHCPLTADQPLSCSSSRVNAVSREAFPS